MVTLGLVPLLANGYVPLALGAGSVYEGKTKVITANVDGEKSVFSTQAETIGEALFAKNFNLKEEDLVEPSLDSFIENSALEVKITKAKPVTVIDGTTTIYGLSPHLSVNEILADLSINVYAADKISVASPLNSVVVLPVIYIDRAPTVMLQIDGQIKEIHTRAETVALVLEAEGIKVEGKDRVEPAPETKITQDLSVNVIRVSETENSEIAEIPFTTIYKEDNNLPKGKTKIERYGQVGQKEVFYRRVIENGLLAEKTVLAQKIIKEPVAQIVIKGTLSYATGSFSEWLNDAGRKYGIDPGKLSRVMYCESGGRPDAVSRTGRFHGLFQYLPSTWAGASVQAGFAGASIYDAKAQIYTTAWKASKQGWGAWPVCGKR